MEFSRAFWAGAIIALLAAFGYLGYTMYVKSYKDPQARITVWVHGTRLTPKWDILDRFFRPPHEGLSLAKDLDPKYHIRTIAQTLAEADANRFPLASFYAFRWNGKLSFKERTKEARRLYQYLIELIAEHTKEHGSSPIVTIITHSHGGNVTLNLSRVKDEFNKQLVVEDLILLASPVQEDTSDFIADPMFKRIYSLYSKMDLLQVADPQGITAPDRKKTNSLFSGRRFPANQKLKQAKVKLHGRAILHVEFMMSRFLRHLPALLNKMDGLRSDNREHIVRIDA